MKEVLIVWMTLCVVLAQGNEIDNSDEAGWTWWHDLQSAGDSRQPIVDVNDDDVALEPRIVGGKPASTGQFPWQVGILKDGTSFCGGSIISSRWVLTAGHCVVNATSFIVVFGSLTPYGDSTGSVVQMTSSYVLHERYRFGLDTTKPSSSRLLLENDIGLIKLSYPLCAWTNKIAVLKLPTRALQSKLFVGESATASGWGFNTYPPKGISPDLMFVNLEVITNQKCDADFRGIIAVLPTAICTGANKARSTYNGDSGGALVWRDVNGTYFQIGIVSFGNGVGSPLDYPSGFARVTSYLDWIANKTGIAIED